MQRIFLILILSTFCFCNEIVIKNNKEVKNSSKIIGEAKLLSPVEIIKKDENFTKVKILGFINENYQARLVKSPSKNEEYFSFFVGNDENLTYKGETNPFIKILDKVEDDYGEIWLKVYVEFDIKNSDLTFKNSLLKESKKLYEQTCSACHHLHNTKEFSVNQWPSNVESMINSGYISLDELEKSLIIKYLQQNAKDSK